MTTIDKVRRPGVLPDGTINVRFVKSDGGFHRHAFLPGLDVSPQITAINAHLQSMGCAQIAEADVLIIIGMASVEHTPERITAFKSEALKSPVESIMGHK